MGTEPISRYFDRKACCEAGASEPAELKPTSRVVLEAIEAYGVSGKSVLELGSGRGGLSRAVAGLGARRVHGVDLSPRSVEEAARLAGRAGLSDRCSYEAGDAAAVPLDPHDVVVLDRVICCFPHPDALLGNAIPAARQAFVYALPESNGLLGAGMRASLGSENVLRWFKRDPFRAYVHDVRRVAEAVAAAGFVRASARHRRGWLVALYTRTG